MLIEVSGLGRWHRVREHSRAQEGEVARDPMVSPSRPGVVRRKTRGRSVFLPEVAYHDVRSGAHSRHREYCEHGRFAHELI